MELPASDFPMYTLTREGFSLREIFAGIAMHALIVGIKLCDAQGKMVFSSIMEKRSLTGEELIAQIALQHADAMIAVLEKEKEKEKESEVGSGN